LPSRTSGMPPEKRYFTLLLTTLSHFWPHNRLDSGVVKKKRAVF
jgi:hypothetical protein